MEKKDRSPSDLNDLTRSVLYEEVPNQNLLRLTSLVIIVGFLFFVFWAAIANVNELSRTKGEILPSGYAQIVQHLEGGIVADIYVEEGDLVEEGQVLLSLGGIGVDQDWAALSERQTVLRLQAERLKALAYKEKPDFMMVEGINDDVIKYQERLLETAREAAESEKKVLQDQLGQKQDMLERLEGEKVTAEKELRSATELFEMKKKLESQGSVSKKDVIDSERDVNKIEGEVVSIISQISEAQNAISEYQNRIQTQDVKMRDQILKDLEEINTQIAQNKETLGKLKDRRDRQSVRAPVRGLVKGLRVNTIGGVIGPGDPILEIVPLDSTLIVEAQISPREVGSLKVGQPARVKVSAFDFSRYGVIEGELEFISATTFSNDLKESYYKGRIKLNKDYVGTDPKRNLILPGMVVEVDIITGRKSVLAYLFKPVYTSLDTAFRER